MNTNNTPIIKFVRLNDRGICPTRSYPTDAGADLYCLDRVVIPPLGRSSIKTGIAISIPQGWYGRIAPRSGLAAKYGIDVLAGVIDSSYRGEICVVLHNTDPYESFIAEESQRIAQIIIERHYNFDFVQTSVLEESERSDRGFGSSGS